MQGVDIDVLRVGLVVGCGDPRLFQERDHSYGVRRIKMCDALGRRELRLVFGLAFFVGDEQDAAWRQERRREIRRIGAANIGALTRERRWIVSLP